MALTDLTPGQKEDLVVSLATLVLADSGAEVNKANLDAVIKASGNASVQPYWASLFAGLLAEKDIDEILLKPGFGGGGGGGGAAPAGGDAGGAAAAEAEEEEEEEEESVEGAGGLFGDSSS